MTVMTSQASRTRRPRGPDRGRGQAPRTGWRQSLRMERRRQGLGAARLHPRVGAINAAPALKQGGQSASALPKTPRTSDVDFLGNGNSIVDLDAEVPHRAFHPLMSEQKLHSTQVACPAVDESRLCAPKRMRPKLHRIETDAGDPFAD